MAKTKKKISPRLRITKLSDFKLDPQNANQHTERGETLLADSLRNRKFFRPVAAVADDTIMAGNSTIAQASGLGMNEAIVIETDGSRPIIHKRIDIKSHKSKEARRLALEDNRVAELSLNWNDAIIADLANDDILAGLWDEKELAALGVETLPKENDDEHAADLVDKAEEINKKWKVRLGDLWECGEHRVICGDCTKMDVVKKILNQKADLCFTDPPYGLGNSLTSKNKYTNYDDTEENLLKLIKHFLPLAREMALTVVLSSGIKNIFLYPKPEWILCWFSSAGVGTGPWGFCCWQPFLVYGKDPFLKNAKGSYPDSYASNDSDKNIPHPCAKPLSVWEWFLNRCSISKGDLIYDPFIGSGTTMIACENLRRKCRAIELNPAYVAVTLQRWSDLTGKQPKLLNGKKK